MLKYVGFHEKIMIADDNKDFYFEIYLNLKPNILLLDFDLPIINGIEIINKLTSISEKNYAI